MIYLITRRFSIIDLVWIILSAYALKEGHYLLWFFMITAGAFISAVIQAILIRHYMSKRPKD